MNEYITVVTSYNRLECTKQCLDSLIPARDDGVFIVVIDNGSTDGSREYIESSGFINILLDENIGCIRAMNMVLEKYRKDGWGLVKIDNDMKQLNNYWYYLINNISGPNLGIIESVIMSNPSKRTLGMCSYYSGLLMDRVCYFDLLHDKHLYGFDDCLIIQKCDQLNLKCKPHNEWLVEITSKENCLGNESKDNQIRNSISAFTERGKLIKKNFVKCDKNGNLICE